MAITNQAIEKGITELKCKATEGENWIKESSGGWEKEDKV